MLEDTMVVVPEPLDVGQWPPDIQRAVYDELAGILTLPSSDYGAMTDEELTQALLAVATEIKTRPSAVTVTQEVTTFGSDVITTVLP